MRSLEDLVGDFNDFYWLPVKLPFTPEEMAIVGKAITDGEVSYDVAQMSLQFCEIAKQPAERRKQVRSAYRAILNGNAKYKEAYGD